MSETMLTKAARAAGEVPATMEVDVRHVLSERAILDIARAVLMAVRDLDEAIIARGEKETWWGFEPPLPERMFTAMIDAILAQEPGA